MCHLYFFIFLPASAASRFFHVLIFLPQVGFSCVDIFLFPTCGSRKSAKNRLAAARPGILWVSATLYIPTHTYVQWGIYTYARTHNKPAHTYTQSCTGFIASSAEKGFCIIMFLWGQSLPWTPSQTREKPSRVIVWYLCDMTHSYVWHDSFLCVTGLIHMWDMTESLIFEHFFKRERSLVAIFNDTTPFSMMQRHLQGKRLTTLTIASFWYVWHNAIVNDTTPFAMTQRHFQWRNFFSEWEALRRNSEWETWLKHERSLVAWFSGISVM